MIAALRRACMPIMLVALAGCSSLPVYRPRLNENLTTLTFSPTIASQHLMLWDDGLFFELVPRDGKAVIPTGKPLMLSRILVAESGNRMYSCSPSLGFVAAAGVEYYADFSVRAEHCRLEVFRIVPGSRVGLTFEPTERGLNKAR